MEGGGGEGEMGGEEGGEKKSGSCLHHLLCCLINFIFLKFTGKSCSSTDPHSYLTSGAVPRKATLSLAAKVAISQALFQPK